jgi:hypothetical protein
VTVKLFNLCIFYIIVFVYFFTQSITMASKVKPPSFINKNYELYKLELQAWEACTELDKAKRGTFIALSLPDNDDTKIKERVFEIS